jgi:hypothetical protein
MNDLQNWLSEVIPAAEQATPVPAITESGNKECVIVVARTSFSNKGSCPNVSEGEFGFVEISWATINPEIARKKNKLVSIVLIEPPLEFNY